MRINYTLANEIDQDTDTITFDLYRTQDKLHIATVTSKGSGPDVITLHETEVERRTVALLAEGFSVFYAQETWSDVSFDSDIELDL